MKTSNIQTSHALAIIKGWVDPVSAGTEADMPNEWENGDSVALTVGDVVVLDSDGTITRTTTAQDTRPVGVVLDDISVGEYGPVVWQGDVDQINTTASVTAGHYAETSTTAGDATSSSTRRVGSFGYYTGTGSNPSAFLFGGGGGSGVAASSSLSWFDVTDYGAVGDGTTDDTTAIAAAITAAAEYDTIYFPTTSATSPTVYKITSTLSVGKALRFLGPSAYPNPDTSPDGRVVIRMATNNTTAIQQSAIKRLGIENIVIDNAGTAASGKGVYALGSVAMRHALIRDFYDNLFIDGQAGGSYMTTIDESFFHNAGRANIYLDDKINNFRMRGGYISTGPYGILASGGIFGMSVDGTAIESYTTAGIYIDGTGPLSAQQTTSVTLANLYMDVVAGTAPDIFLGDTSAVQNVYIENIWIEPGSAAQVHIRIDAGDRIIIKGGRIRSNAGGSTSISASAATNITLENVKADGTVTLPSTARDYTPFDVTPSSIGVANSAGTSTYVARADHVHDGSSAGASFATPAIVLGTAAAAGAASTVIRSDSTIVAFDATVPVTQAFGDVAATGSAAVAARRDHRHGMPASGGSGGLGPLLLASDKASPIVFDDILQASDGNDFLYASAP